MTRSASQQAEPVLLVRQGSVGIITINRPDVMNSVNEEVAMGIGAALDELEDDPNLRVGVITGAGRSFCAGADLKNLAAGGTFLAPQRPDWGFGGMTQRFTEIPLIAAVNGFALGGGAEIVLACDLAVMSIDATIGLPEVKRGLIAGAGGLLRLPDQIPQKIAARAVLTGEPLSAAEALGWGLVNAVVPPGLLLPEALRLAQSVAANAPLAIAASKRLMAHRRDHGSDWNHEAWASNQAVLDAILATRDVAEGARAFAEKRAPHWAGA